MNEPNPGKISIEGESTVEKLKQLDEAIFLDDLHKIGEPEKTAAQRDLEHVMETHPGAKYAFHSGVARETPRYIRTAQNLGLISKRKAKQLFPSDGRRPGCAGPSKDLAAADAKRARRAAKRLGR